MLVPFIVLSFLTTFAHAVFSTLPVGATFKQCSTVTLAWTELPPVQMWVVPDRQIKSGDPVLESLGVIRTSTYQWTVDLPVGQVVSFTYVRMADRNTLLASPQSYTVVAGDSAACIKKTVSTTTTSTTSALIRTTTSALATTSSVRPTTSSSSVAPTTSATVTHATLATTQSSSSRSTVPVSHSSSSSSSSSSAQPTNSAASDSKQNTASSSPSTGVIIGAIGGGVVLLLALLGGIVFACKRRRKDQEVDDILAKPPYDSDRMAQNTPYPSHTQNVQTPQMAYGSVPQTGSFPHFSQVAQFSPGPSPYAHSPYAPMSPYHPQAGNMYAMSDMSMAPTPGFGYHHPAPPPQPAFGYAPSVSTHSFHQGPADPYASTQNLIPPTASGYVYPFAGHGSDAGSSSAAPQPRPRPQNPISEKERLRAEELARQSQLHVVNAPPAYEDVAQRTPPAASSSSAAAAGSSSARPLSRHSLAGDDEDAYGGLAYERA